MVGIRVFESNLPDKVRSTIQSSRDFSVSTILSHLSQHSENDDLFTIWYPSVHRLLDSFKISNEDLSSLFAIIFSFLKGSDLSLDGLQSTLTLLNRILKFKRNLKLTIKWQEVFGLYQTLVDDSKFVVYSKAQIAGIVSELASVIRKMRRYFCETANEEICQYFLKRVSLGGDTSNSLVFLCNLIPNKGKNKPIWVPIIIDLLETKPRNLNLAINVICCLSTTAKNYPDLDWSPYLPKLYNLILPSLPLLPMSLPRPKTFYSESIKTTAFSSKFIYRSSSFAKLVAYSLSLENIHLLDQWLKNMSSSIKEGKMISSGYINYISRIVANYCKRIKLSKEHKAKAPAVGLTENLVKLVVPYVTLVFYSGHLSQIDRLCVDLAYLSPDSIIPMVVEKCVEVIEDFNIPHLDAINVLGRLIKPLLEPTIFAKGLEYLPLILNLTLNELSSADILKSCKIIELYGQVTSYLKINSSLSGVYVWAEEFFKTLLVALSDLEESSDNKQEKARSFQIESTLSINMKAISSSVDDEIFHIWLEDFFEFITRNNCNNALGEFGILITNLARREPAKVINRIFALVEKSLDHAEKQLMWRVHLLSASFINAGGYLETCWTRLQGLIPKLIEKHSEEAGELLTNYLSGLLNVYPLSYSGFLSNADAMNPNESRGKISNQSTKNPIDLEIDWKEPSPKGISIANEIFQKYILTVPTDKAAAKGYFKASLPLVKIWSQFYVNPEETLGKIRIPSSDYFDSLMKFEEGIFEIVKKLDESGFIYEDPLVLELFVGFVCAAIHCEEFSVLEVKKESKPVNELKKRHANPLVVNKEKNSYESRFCLVLRTESHLNTIKAARLSQKTFSATFDYFLHILLKLTVDQYKQVRNKAISALESVLSNSFIGLKNIIRQLWTEIGRNLDITNPELLKLQIEVLVNKGTLWRKDICNTDFIILDLLKKTHTLLDIEIHSTIFNIYCNFVLSSNPDCRLRNGKIIVNQSEALNQKVAELLKETRNYHWRPLLYSCLYFLINMPSLYASPVFEDIKKFIAQMLTEENIDIRETAVNIAISAFYNQIHHQVKFEFIEFTPVEFSEDLRGFDMTNSTHLLSYKTFQGWNNIKDLIKISPPLNSSRDAFYEFFNSLDSVKKYFEFSAVSHMVVSEENIVKNPRARNVEALSHSVKFLNNPYKFLDSLLRVGNRFNRTSSEFFTSKARLIKLYGRLHGPESVSILIEQCKEFIMKEKPYQQAAVEVFAGIGRASKHWENAEVFQQLLQFVLKNCAFQGLAAWLSGFEFICKNQRPLRLIGFFDSILLELKDAGSKKTGKLLKILGVVIQSLSWRGARLYPRVFEVLTNISHDIFAHLRKSVASVISTIVKETSFISKSPQDGLYKSLQLNPDSYLIFYSPVLTYLNTLQSSSDSLSAKLILDILSQIYIDADLDYSVFPYLSSTFTTIFSLLKSPDIKFVTEASEVLKSISALRCTQPVYLLLQSFIQSQGVSDSKVQELIKGLFLTLTWFYNQFLINAPTDYFQQSIASSNIEVRQTGKYYLSMIWRVETEANKAEEFLRIKAEKNENKVTEAFRLSALILSQKEFIEPWKGEALSTLCRMKKYGGEIALCVNSTLAEFWKHHKAWWKSYMNYSKTFSSEESEMIESFNSDHTYFA